MMSIKIELYVPSMTKQGIKFDHDAAVVKALHKMTELFGGATASAKFKGAYRMESGELAIEDIVIVTSYTNETDHKAFIDCAAALRSELQQECVAVVINNTMHFV